MFYGIIRIVNREKGYGFIAADRGPDVFFMLTSVDEGGLVGRIVPRQAVMYVPEKVQRDDDGNLLPTKGPRAERVVLIDRVPGDSLPPADESMQVKHHPKSRQRKPSWRR